MNFYVTVVVELVDSQCYVIVCVISRHFSYLGDSVNVGEACRVTAKSGMRSE